MIVADAPGVRFSSGIAAAEIHVALRGVTRVYPAHSGHGEVHALGPVDLDLKRGEFVGIVGPSGCGKSTLLETVAGLVMPTTGTVTFEGAPVRNQVPEGVGVVFQEDASFPWLNVRDNVAFGLQRAGVDEAEVKRRVDHAIAFMGLNAFRTAYPSQLSGGMRQRVCIARTLVLRPRLILLDEPFGALDQQTRLLMGEELLRLWRETGATVMLITHALDEATMLSDRVAVMSSRPGTLHRHPRHALAAQPRLADRGRTWLRAVHEPPLGAHPRRVEKSARMKHATLWRAAVVIGMVLALEVLCRSGVVNPFTMIPPSQMALALVDMIRNADWFWPDARYTFQNIIAAILLSIGCGFTLGLMIHALPRLRRVLNPVLLSYYSVPTFVFYPLLIVIFGIGPTSLVVMGAMFGIVAMICATLTGIDRIPRVYGKVARVSRLTPLQSAVRIKLPAATPHLFTGLKLAVAYSVIGVIAGEFIIATAGLGRRLTLAYNEFDNATMYGLILLIFIVVAVINTVLQRWEARIYRRWYRS